MNCEHRNILRRGMGLLILAVAACSGSSCVTHQARITPPVPNGEARSPRNAPVMVVASAVQRDLGHEQVREDCLPIDLPISAWVREPSGEILRYEGRVTTPLPWWQRFPADIISDALPPTFLCPASATVVLAPIPVIDPVAFVAQARRDGYGRTTATAPVTEGQQP